MLPNDISWANILARGTEATLRGIVVAGMLVRLQGFGDSVVVELRCLCFVGSTSCFGFQVAYKMLNLSLSVVHTVKSGTILGLNYLASSQAQQKKTSKYNLEIR